MVRFVPYNPISHQVHLLEMNIEFLTWIANQMRLHHNIDAETQGSMTIREYVEEHLKKFTTIRPPKGIIYLLESDGDVIGMGALCPVDERVGEIKRMYIRPEHRGKGIGRKLLTKLMEKAKAFGYSTLRLESQDFMTVAHQLYRSMGFQDTDPFSDCETPNWYIHCNVFMKKDL